MKFNLKTKIRGGIKPKFLKLAGLRKQIEHLKKGNKSRVYINAHGEKFSVGRKPTNYGYDIIVAPMGNSEVKTKKANIYLSPKKITLKRVGTLEENIIDCEKKTIF